MYHLRQVQIDAMTRYDYLGAIGLDCCDDGCLHRLRPPLHTQADDIITRSEEPTLITDVSCFKYDSIRHQRFNGNQVDLINFERDLPKGAFQPTIRSINLRSIRSRKVERQLRALDKADQVNHWSAREDREY